MKISIIGSGAMGSLYGGKLSLAGHDVVLFDVFREHVEKVCKDGLAIEDAATGDVVVARPRASTEPQSVEGSDVLIVFVKSTATEDAGGQVQGAGRASDNRADAAERAGKRGDHPQAFRSGENRRGGDLPGRHFPRTRPHTPRGERPNAHQHGGRKQPEACQPG